LHLTEQLLSRASLTPDDARCQELIANRLKPLGFECHTLVFGPVDFRVTNLWALRRGSDPQGPLLVFAGHTDVVPTGPLGLSGSATLLCPRIGTACCMPEARLT
jgi:succinyl-diaminopimelate desuccinylase